MRTLKPYLMLIVLVIAVCFYGAQGQYSMPSMPVSSSHISAPIQTLIVGKTPATIYLGSQQQSVPNSQYQTNANNAGPSLWIQGDGGWIQYATIPQGSAVTLIAGSPTGGSGYLREVLNGTAYNYNFYFYPHSQLTFYGDAIGQHVLSYTLNGQSSNQVTIDVTAYVSPQYYRTPYGYRALYNYPTPGYYPQSYYYSKLPYSSYKYRRHMSPFYGGYSWNYSNYPWLNAP